MAMKHSRKLAALFAATALSASPALAQTYTAISNSSFASQTAASPSANPGSVGKGWIDVAGNVWAVAATYIDPTLVGGSPWNAGLLARQSSENTAAGVTQKIEADFSAYQMDA